MREALIVWAAGAHEPSSAPGSSPTCSKSSAFNVHVETKTEGLRRPFDPDLSLIVPIITMRISRRRAAESHQCGCDGVGLAGFHGGMCDAFRDLASYQFMCAAMGRNTPAT